MAEIDRLTMERYGLNSLVLMENAARSILPFIPLGKVGILVGPGNNGGDGLVLARALKEQQRPVEVLVLSPTLSAEAQTQKSLAESWGVPFTTYFDSADSNSNLVDFLADKEVIVDALFGTGLARPLTKHWKTAVELTNSCPAQRLSIDLPSGLHGGSGQVLGAAVRAHQTVTFGCLKRAHLLHPGAELCGTVHLTQPGFHPQALRTFDRVQLFTKSQAARLLPKTWPTMHKGDNGRLLLVTGSRQYPGAGLISVLGALQAGAGLVTHSTPSELVGPLLSSSPEAMPAPRPQIPTLTDFNAIVVGSGLGEDAKGLGLEVMKSTPVPTVVDADALWQLDSIPATQRQKFVLTPHPGELAKLLNRPVRDLEQDRITTALEAAETLGCVVCSKGAPTVVATPDQRAFVNSTGNAVLSQGGTGDLLAGINGAYLAQGLPPYEAAACGSFIHGLAADMAKSKLGPKGIVAHKISELVPNAYGDSVGDPSAFPVF